MEGVGEGDDKGAGLVHQPVLAVGGVGAGDGRKLLAYLYFREKGGLVLSAC